MDEIVATAAASVAKSLQSCPTLCAPRDSSPSGSSVHGILQARILEWVAISFSIIVVTLLSNIRVSLIPALDPNNQFWYK